MKKIKNPKHRWNAGRLKQKGGKQLRKKARLRPVSSKPARVRRGPSCDKGPADGAPVTRNHRSAAVESGKTCPRCLLTRTARRQRRVARKATWDYWHGARWRYAVRLVCESHAHTK